MRGTLAALVGFAIALHAQPALSASSRTFVSGTGVDAGACDPSAPCRNFTYALAQTGAGGEIVVVSSGSFAPFTIANAISIVAPGGVYADVAAKNKTPGIVIAAGATDVVTLRGLTVSGPARGDGIDYDSGGVLNLEGVEVSGFNGANKAGLKMATVGKLIVRNSTFRDNYHGVLISAPTGSANASLDRVNLTNNASVGLYALDNALVTISNCVASGNAYGLDAQTSGTGPASLNVASCQVASNSADGIVVGGGVATALGGLPEVYVANSTVTNNGGYGLHGDGNLVGFRLYSQGNNNLQDNGFGGEAFVNSFSPF